MIRGYAAVKGNLRRPRKGATVYKRPELAVVFGALEAVPGGALFEGSVSDIPAPEVWQAGLLVKGTFTADPIQQGIAPAISDAQRLRLALLCYLHVLGKTPHVSAELQRWARWAQTWIEAPTEEATAGLAEMINLEWPYPGLRYLLHAGYQITSGRVLRDLTSTVITQAMTDLLRIADQYGLRIEEDVLLGIIQDSRTR
jgi:hypothetical protein